MVTLGIRGREYSVQAWDGTVSGLTLVDDMGNEYSSESMLIHYGYTYETTTCGIVLRLARTTSVGIAGGREVYPTIGVKLATIQKLMRKVRERELLTHPIFSGMDYLYGRN